MLTSRTFRIFVSSTFADMREEREALQRWVFPRLREFCERYGARFQAIDLRWGVSEEAGLDQRTMSICLTEIERCQRATPRPNFVVLLGDRYGWRPLPAEIPANVFEQLEGRIKDADDQRLLGRWYRRDNNAVEAVFCLAPRSAEFEDVQRWERVEQRLRSILLRGTRDITLDADDRLLYTASATEHEIVHGALRVPDAREHVFCFFRNIKNEKGFALVDNLPPERRVEQFVDLIEVAGRSSLDTEASSLLGSLKDELRKSLGDNVHEYQATWTGTGTSGDHIGALPEQLDDCIELIDDTRIPSTLCTDVWRRLARSIRSELERVEQVEPLDREIGSHEAFARDRTEFFVGRKTDLEAIANYLRGADPRLFAVVGEGGSGKSTLLAKAAQEARNERPERTIVVRMIGATAASSDVRSLLESLCREIARAYGADETTVPSDYEELVAEFPKRMALAVAERPLILFLDGLDHLSEADRAGSLAWLPASLPEHVRVVVTTLRQECETTLQNKRPVPRFAALEPIPAAEGKKLLDVWLSEARRTLQLHQHEELWSKFARSGMPLYLKLAVEEARLWKSFADPRTTLLHEEIPNLIRLNLFHRLERPQNHGQVLVSHALGYLAASRYGLSEDELIGVLSADDEVKRDFRLRSPKSPMVDEVPVVVWSRLHFDLERYLSERVFGASTLLAFYHQQLQQVAEEEYLQSAEGLTRHRALAAYFHGRADPERDRSWSGNDLHSLSELPYHYLEAGDLEAYDELLCDPAFIQAKVRSGMLYGLIGDYALAEQNTIAATGMGLGRSKARMLIGQAIALSADALQGYPDQLRSQLVGRLLGFQDPTLNEFLRRVDRIGDDGWLRPLVPALSAPGAVLQREWQAHDFGIDGLDADLSGQILCSRDSAGTIRYWDLLSGKRIGDIEGRSTFGPRPLNAQPVIDLSSRDWSRMGSETRRLRIADHAYAMLNSRHQIDSADGRWRFEAVSRRDVGIRGVGDRYEARVNAYRKGRGGPRRWRWPWRFEENLVARLIDYTAHFGDAESRAIGEGGTGSPIPAATVLAFSADGRFLIAGCADGHIRRWVLPTLEPYADTVASRAMITALVPLPDGGLVFATIAGRIGVLVANADESRVQLPSLGEPPAEVVLTSDGRLALCLGSLGTISLWDVMSGNQGWRCEKGALAPYGKYWDLRFHSVAISDDGSHAAAFIVDEDMYGGLGIIGIGIHSRTTSVVFDPESGSKKYCEGQVGVGVRSVFRDRDRYFVEAGNGSLWFADGSGRAPQDTSPPPRPTLGNFEVRGAGSSLVELIAADGSPRARFLLDDRISATALSRDETVVAAASKDGALAFLSVVEGSEAKNPAETSS